MKPALLILFLAAFGASADAQADARAAAAARAGYAVDAPWTASISKSDPAKLHVSIIEKEHGMLGTSLPIAELEGLTADELKGTGRPVTFVLRRQSGTITFSGRFANGTGQGTLRYVADPAYFARLAAIGVRNDLSTERANVLALPMLDLRTDYIEALRREGAFVDLSDYIGMRAVGVRPEMVHELKPLIAGPLNAHDMMALAALGVTPAYAREMRGAYASLSAGDLTAMKALGVTPAYVAEMRAAGARIRTPGDAQSFRALGISPAAVRRAVAHGRPNPSASEVMEATMRF
ncbi:hypothetical protein GON01_00220 [Sphingomonas sp. MAH-20]|uniref:Helix-hairpin-helix domain-containing protein n=1 Tax=Sphingomonas horti TaxID=2682842 RepID=A0A6I4IWA7_9SPHN|nr:MULTISPECIES: hypothetical protein [Sphingomonas]MBA2920112.1 hypothetical protein [Sphingomonas sp. CGMCC 1.13658]MVO76367.1 hypothetical protein [Sphingomonas horti]